MTPNDPHPVLDDPERLALFQGGLVSREGDTVLDGLVREAARTSDSPVAVVSLVMGRVQFFRSYVGLPPELELSRATDRRVSICRQLVQSGEPLIVEDAAARDEFSLLPLFGLRSYAGVPVKAAGHLVGGLCVMSPDPNRYDELLLSRLEAIGRAVSARLTDFLSARMMPPTAAGQAIAPAFAEMRNALSAGVLTTASLRLFAVESELALAPLLERGPRELTAEQLARAVESLKDMSRAMGDLRLASEEVERSLRRVKHSLGLLEEVTARTPEPGTVGEALELACLLAHHSTKLVGG